MFKTKKAVIDWFGDRGLPLKPASLKAWHWAEGTLWFVIEGSKSIYFSDTDHGMVDVTKTHDENGNPILVYELYDTVAISESPLAE